MFDAGLFCHPEGIFLVVDIAHTNIQEDPYRMTTDSE
jgi:hypothetical protein